AKRLAEVSRQTLGVLGVYAGVAERVIRNRIIQAAAVPGACQLEQRGRATDCLIQRLSRHVRPPYVDFKYINLIASLNHSRSLTLRRLLCLATDESNSGKKGSALTLSHAAAAYVPLQS